MTFVLALLTVIYRLFALNLQQRKRLGLDDVFLIFATVLLLAATITVLISLDQIYFVESLTLNGAAAIISSGTNDWIDQITYFSKINWAWNAVTWASIFFVKFSFLTFFSGLCDRLPKTELYRKIVYGFCVVVFLYAVLVGFIDCPHLGLDACELLIPHPIKLDLFKNKH